MENAIKDAFNKGFIVGYNSGIILKEEDINESDMQKLLLEKDEIKQISVSDE